MGRTIATRILAAALLLGASLLTPPAATAGVAERDTPSRGRWPGGVIAYEFDGRLPAADRAMTTRAIAAWNAALGPSGHKVRFVPFEQAPRGAARLYVVRVGSTTSSPLCRATPGFQVGTLESVRLEPAEVFTGGLGGRPIHGELIFAGRCSQRSITHELGHVLGLRHEHERQDRREWVSISPLNGAPSPDCRVKPPGGFARLWCDNYQARYNLAGARDLPGQPGLASNSRLVFSRTYDVCSIMQYVETSVHEVRGVRLKFTQAARDAAKARHCPLGGSGGVVSRLDAQLVRAMYPAR